MPLNQYHIQPINVSNSIIYGDQRGNEIECIANSTLANLMRQLGSLSEQSSKIFEDLTHEARKLNDRAKIANERIQNIKKKTESLDYKTENLTKLDDFLNCVKPFESKKNFDQQIFSKDSMPEAMKALYAMAEPPPDLNRFDKHRDDGKDSLKLYTDPGYFFTYWRDGLIQENYNRRNDRKRKKSMKNKRRPDNRQTERSAHDIFKNLDKPVHEEPFNVRPPPPPPKDVFSDPPPDNNNSRYINYEEPFNAPCLSPPPTGGLPPPPPLPPTGGLPPPPPLPPTGGLPPPPPTGGLPPPPPLPPTGGLPSQPPIGGLNDKPALNQTPQKALEVSLADQIASFSKNKLKKVTVADEADMPAKPPVSPLQQLFGDISKGAFKLKPTKPNNGQNKYGKQDSFKDNKNVTAILDFVTKEYSDDENSQDDDESSNNDEWENQ